VDAGVGQTVGAGAQQLDRSRLGVALLAFRDLGANAVAGQGAGDEDDEAVSPSDPPPAEGEGVDLEL
jgi:hypothetical protein